MQTADARAREADRGLPAEPVARPVRRRDRHPRVQRGGRSRRQRANGSTPTSSPSFPLPARITIADNASTDGTWAIAQRPRRRARRRAGRAPGAEGPRPRAAAPSGRPATPTVVAYMDVDLSTDLNALLPLVAPLLSGHSDVAIGSRLTRSSRVVRGARRELISRSYNLLLRATLRARFSDAQCGFKAIRSDCARRLLPLVEDTGWFFDTELLVLAERAGLRIHEVPVDWVDDPDSRVDIVSTAVADLRGMARVGRALATGALPLAELRRQVGRAPLEPPVPGVHRTLLGQAVRFARRRRREHRRLPRPLPRCSAARSGAQGANLVALVLTAVFNTAANRRLTFGVRGRDGVAASQLRGFVVFGVGLALTSGSLAAARRRRARRLAARGARRARAGQRARDRRPLPALPRLGLPRPPARLTLDDLETTMNATHPAAGLPGLAAPRRRARSPRGCGASRAAPRSRPPGCGRRSCCCWPARPCLYLWALGDSGWGNDFYAVGRPGGRDGLEGVPLRLARPRQRHHRRQAARVAVADGRSRCACSASRAGACSCRRRSAASPPCGCCYAERAPRGRGAGRPRRRAPCSR